MQRMRLIIVLAVVVGAFAALASSASASYQRVVPSGINGSSPSLALRDVKSIADSNDQYAQVLARETGATTYNASDYRAIRFGKASASTNNSALSGSGNLVPTWGGVGTKTVVVKNVRTGGYVAIMIRCGNPRLKDGTPRRVKILKTKRIFIHKKFSMTVQHICPSGQAVNVTASGVVKGWLRVSARGWASQARVHVSAQVSLIISQRITIECGGTPPPQGIICKAGDILNSAGICVSQSNAAEQNCKAIGGTFNGATQLCTIIQINGNCSNITVVNGSGNVVNVTQEGNCNSSPPPPTCPPGSIGTPPSCVWPGPSAQIDAGPAHFFVNGNGYIYARVRAGTGRNLTSVTISVTDGHTSGLVGSTTYDGAACPTGWSCFSTQYWAPPYTVLAPDFVTATVIATQDDTQSISNSTQFEIKLDAGF